MKDYEPLDLRSSCNVGQSFFNQPEGVLIGSRQLIGLPFVVGGKKPDPKRCFIGFAGQDGRTDSVEIPVGKKARHVVFAHTLLESKLHEGDSVGRRIATYVMKLTDGSTHEIPIRERSPTINLEVEGKDQRPFLACRAAHHQHEHDVTHHHGQDGHLAFLKEPFHDATAAIHQRMHQLGIPH